MDLKKFSAYKYQHAGRSGISKRRWRVVVVTLVVALLATIAFFPGGAILFLVPLIAYFSAPKMLYIGPRYLICGDTIMYFSNVVKVTLEENSGTLQLTSSNGKTFVVERDKFPTNARKTNKIAANKATKFRKSSARLIEKILRATPDVELSGVPRSAYRAG